jgi:CBS domain-containing protein
MSSPAFTIGPADEVAEAARILDLGEIVALMSGTMLKSLPVLLHGRIVGMVSRRDGVRALAHGDLGSQPADDLSPA